MEDVLGSYFEEEDSEERSGDVPNGRTQERKGPLKPKKRTPDGRLLVTNRRPQFALPELPGDLQLMPLDALHELHSRQRCPTCGKSQHYYCFNCCRPFSDPSRTPLVRLPFHVHLVLHRDERRSRSTGIHAAVLAPGDVTVHSWEEAQQGSLRCLAREPDERGRQTADRRSGDAPLQLDTGDKLQSTGAGFLPGFEGDSRQAEEGNNLAAEPDLWFATAEKPRPWSGGEGKDVPSAAVLFPSKDAVGLSEMDISKIQHIVVVESKVHVELGKF